MANLSGTPPQFSFNFYFSFCRLVSTNGRMAFDFTQGLNEVMARVFFCSRTSNQAKYSRLFFTVGIFFLLPHHCAWCVLLQCTSMSIKKMQRKRDDTNYFVYIFWIMNKKNVSFYLLKHGELDTLSKCSAKCRQGNATKVKRSTNTHTQTVT